VVSTLTFQVLNTLVVVVGSFTYKGCWWVVTKPL